MLMFYAVSIKLYMQASILFCQYIVVPETSSTLIESVLKQALAFAMHG